MIEKNLLDTCNLIVKLRSFLDRPRYLAKIEVLLEALLQKCLSVLSVLLEHGSILHEHFLFLFSGTRHMHRFHVFESLGDEDSIQENLSILEADHFVVGGEEYGATILHKVEIVVPGSHHLGTNCDIIVQKERLFADIFLFNVQSEPLNVECAECFHAHWHPIVETGDALDCNLVVVCMSQAVFLSICLTRVCNH